MAARSRISIVTPCLDQAAFVEWTVRSVLGQRYPDIEYIVMDGGSTDGSLEILERYAGRFAALESGPDGGQANAIRRGLERSTGDIVAWLNSDDMLAPGAVAFVAELLERRDDIDLVYSHRCFIDADNVVTGYWILPPHDDELLRLRDMVPQETCFWRRSLLDRGGNVDPSYEFAMDYDLLLRYARCGGRLHRAPCSLAAFRRHPGSKTERCSHDVGRRELRRLAEAHGLPRGPAALARSRALRETVRLRSAWHALARRPLDGARPGTGWRYDELWGLD